MRLRNALGYPHGLIANETTCRKPCSDRTRKSPVRALESPTTGDPDEAWAWVHYPPGPTPDLAEEYLRNAYAARTRRGSFPPPSARTVLSAPSAKANVKPRRILGPMALNSRPEMKLRIPATRQAPGQTNDTMRLFRHLSLTFAH